MTPFLFHTLAQAKKAQQSTGKRSLEEELLEKKRLQLEEKKRKQEIEEVSAA